MSGQRAKKSLGQHFLADRRYLAPILEAATLAPDDRVLEIGPGQGVLTEALVEQVKCLVAVELDDRLIEPLRQQFAGQANVHIVHGDILEHAPAQLVASACWTEDEIKRLGDWRLEIGDSQSAPSSPNPPISPSPNLQSPNLQSPNLQSPNLQSPNLQSPNLQSPNLQSPISYKVVANLPYYITSAVLRHLLEAAPPPALAVLMVQWEVAQRICAAPGEMSLLAVSVQFYAAPRIVARVPAAAFRPRPKVDSAILHLEVRAQPAVDIEAARFFSVVRAGFSQKRKQLHNSLAAGLNLDKAAVHQWLSAAGVTPTRRAETLSLAEWGELCQHAPCA
ncbi:MAG: 16S rRNA (adenine(1518)-N(6)/adenine(1519)-N(6))-dimethyltransferase [Caldilineaceae bacterium]|nr:16S rRNA (adenine(1518)-N(6)/adenine(1519)-N(6))-dimethyltransferase [Caldilineaceae bacterium]